MCQVVWRKSKLKSVALIGAHRGHRLCSHVSMWKCPSRCEHVPGRVSHSVWRTLCSCLVCLFARCTEHQCNLDASSVVQAFHSLANTLQRAPELCLCLPASILPLPAWSVSACAAAWHCLPCTVYESNLDDGQIGQAHHSTQACN